MKHTDAIDVAIGQRVRHRRLALGLSQEAKRRVLVDVAEALADLNPGDCENA